MIVFDLYNNVVKKDKNITIQRVCMRACDRMYVPAGVYHFTDL
jgi:hypothetical protein